MRGGKSDKEKRCSAVLEIAEIPPSALSKVQLLHYVFTTEVVKSEKQSRWEE